MTTVSLATSQLMREGLVSRLVSIFFEGDQEVGRDQLDSGLIFFWLLVSLEKQMGIYAHKATLKAKGFKN